MVSVAEDLKRTTELLGSEGRMQSEEDLNHLDWALSALCNCTHLVLIVVCVGVLML